MKKIDDYFDKYPGLSLIENPNKTIKKNSFINTKKINTQKIIKEIDVLTPIELYIKEMEQLIKGFEYPTPIILKKNPLSHLLETGFYLFLHQRNLMTENSEKINISTQTDGEELNKNILIEETDDDGLPIRETDDDGLPIRKTDDDGLPIRKTDDDGLSIRETDDDGLKIRETDDDGLPIRETDDE